MTAKEKAAHAGAASPTKTNLHRSPISIPVEIARRRRAAAARLPVLERGVSDPWIQPRGDIGCRGAAEAVAHLADAGVLPMLPVDVLRDAWADASADERAAIAWAVGAVA